MDIYRSNDVELSYAACTLGGSKHQLLRHNIMTRLANGQWPTAIMCMTLRSGLGTPATDAGYTFQGGSGVYSCSMLFWHSPLPASWWAWAVGSKAWLSTACSPSLSVGRREHWPDMDPKAMREWAMAPITLMLGLTSELQASRPGLPVRKPVTDVMISGQGAGRGDLRRVLWDALLEMAGMTLACDCPIDQMCEADLLIGFDSQPLQ